MDTYKDLDSLKREMRKGRDYRIRTKSRASKVLVISPHGGFIEIGTSAIANAIAAAEYSLFDFQGLLSSDAFRLHITSHRFRDPALNELVARADYAVSVHGMPNPATGPNDQIWLGGRNVDLKEVIATELRKQNFLVNTAPPMYKGEHVANVVNLPVHHGVQMELSISLRRQMFATARTFCINGRCPKTTAVFNRFVEAVRAGIRNYELTR